MTVFVSIRHPIEKSNFCERETPVLWLYINETGFPLAHHTVIGDECRTSLLNDFLLVLHSPYEVWHYWDRLVISRLAKSWALLVRWLVDVLAKFSWLTGYFYSMELCAWMVKQSCRYRTLFTLLKQKTSRLLFIRLQYLQTKQNELSFTYLA